MSYSIIGADNNIYGPVDGNTLVRWANEGRITNSTTVIDHSTGMQMKAYSMPMLAPYITPPASGYNQSSFFTSGYTSRTPQVGADGRPLKSKLAAGLLGIFLGSLGIHRFYLGYTGIGILMLLITVLSLGFLGIIVHVWGLIEGIMCLTGNMVDADCRPLGD
jgi:TM2 domain-containing membrane protein YozV